MITHGRINAHFLHHHLLLSPNLNPNLSLNHLNLLFCPLVSFLCLVFLLDLFFGEYIR
jgi:hypothetical protein